MATFTYDDETFSTPTGKYKDLDTTDAFIELEKNEPELIELDNEKDKDALVKGRGFESFKHYLAYKGYLQDNLDFEVYGQKKMAVQMAAYQQTMADSAASMAGTEIMAPISGVTFEQYATINAQMSSGKDYQTMLKEMGIESVSWEKASEGWAERMRTDTTYTLVNEFGKYFMAAGQGQFGDVAKDVAGGMSGNQSTAKSDVSFELYVEMVAASGAAVKVGKDPIAALAAYGLSAGDYATVGQYWAQKMMQDMSLGAKFGDLLKGFEAKFEADAPKVADDIDF